jgi:predicted enzyme related to lactoylglutathione lyase
MTQGVQTVIFPVRDLDKAKALFNRLLDAEPIMDQPYYVGYKAAGQDIGLDPNGHDKGMTGPLAFWAVDDIEATLKQLLGAGAEQLQAPSDVGGGKLVASVRDADGNPIGLIQEP